MKIRDGTLKRLLAAVAPLLLWAGHWALMYLLAALHVDRAVMIGLSLAALLAACALLWRAARRRDGSLHRLAFGANAVLALIAIAWTSVALVLLA